MTERAGILVVDDEPQIQRFLKPSLTAAGYDVTQALNGPEAIKAAGLKAPRIVIVDLGLPDMDGKDVIRELRKWLEVPIIVLSARDREAENIAALDLGADDYVTKPFSITELLARVRAVLRRTGQQKPTADAIRIGDIEIDFKLHQARRGKTRIEFTAREFDLLRYFVQHTGQVVTREQILNEVWGYEEFPTTRTIDNFVAKLRQKIERSPHAPEHILTIHGSGYKFVG